MLSTVKTCLVMKRRNSSFGRFQELSKYIKLLVSVWIALMEATFS